MLDLATLPLSLHKETAGSGLSRLDILRAKYSTTNNIAQQQASYQKLLADFPENNRNQYLMTHIHNALNLNIDYGTIKADLLKLPQINRPGIRLRRRKLTAPSNGLKNHGKKAFLCNRFILRLRRSQPEFLYQL
ncbi:MAG: hypothetical protein L6W00_09350 [Lentisphaeria bacterium]|nr:MAG: hypothetical protein L6W00_09350 [Lentisphaeria bacterium]